MNIVNESVSINEYEYLIEQIGGKENIQAFHEDGSRVIIELANKLDAQNLKKLKESDGIPSFIQINSQLEFVPDKDSPKEFVNQLKTLSIKTERKKFLDQAIEFVSSVFTPLLPLFAGSGILKGLLILLITFGWISETSGTYIVLSSAANAVFQFLPILVAFSTARKLKVNPFIAALLSAALMEPGIVGLLNGNTSETISFIGLPMVLMEYSSTVIPAILATSFYALVEKQIKKIVGESFQLIVVPLVALTIVVPFTLIVFGPFGIYLGNFLGYIVNGLLSFNGMISGALIASGWLVFVIFGLHWALYPIIIGNIASVGFDTILPLTGVANFALAGATLAVLLKTKNKNRKSIATSGLMSLFLAGIGEPSIYGVTLPLKRPFIATCIGSAVGGAVAGFFHTKALALVFVGIPTLPAFLTDTFIYFIISISVGFLVAFLTTWMIGFDEEI
ncbi:MAG: PTS transporter subunit EIIC [Carnobacterium sp.]|uniref:PTS transporter subunit EIIC n=1 Tax=Carnobacterium sp. TaxID=48221 RepID=UPI002FCA1326